MSSATIRYSEPLVDALADDSAGEIFGADFYGPMALQPTQTGLFWYGIHSVEMLYAALGQGCTHVTTTTNDDYDFVVGVWRDGRIGTVRGNRRGNNKFGGLVHRTGNTQLVNASNHPKPAYAGLLERVLTMFQGGQPNVALDETVEIVRFIEAANRSRETGETVAL
jgi:predicted dehydrogenase